MTAITFEQGHEHAPDSPWGLQRIRLSREGTFHYERINRGTRAEIEGRLDGARVDALLAELSKTSFPEPPQRSFPPGASVCRISVDASPPAWVDIEFYTGLRMPGYGEILRSLDELNTGLRESDARKLQGWSLVREAESNETSG